MKENTQLALYRLEIDSIDQQIAKLFQKRMDIVKKIALEKKNQKLDILDASREEQVLQQNLPLIKKEYQAVYQDLLKEILKLSKEIQSKVWVELDKKE